MRGILGLLAALHAACITTDIRTGEEPRPPRIPFNRVDPRPGLVIITDPATQLPMTFTVSQFEEPNETDTLTVRWFVDYHRNPAIQRQNVRPPQPQLPPGVRAGSEFQLTLSMLEPNVTTEPHLVEVIVSDRPFDDPGTPTERNRTLAADALGDLLSWTVFVPGPVRTKPLALELGAPLLRPAPPLSAEVLAPLPPAELEPSPSAFVAPRGWERAGLGR